MRSVAERLVLGEAAHANPDRFCLRFNFQWSFVRFDDSAHCQSYAVRNSSQASDYCLLCKSIRRGWRACDEIQAELFDLVHIVTALLRASVQSSRARSAYGNAVRVVVKKTAAQRNTNTAAAPVHSQKPRCQNTECRSMLRTGIAQDGFNRVSSNKDSLRKIPASGNSVTNDQVQNNPARKRRPFHAHQQPHNIVSAKNPPTERPNNSCIRRIAQTSWVCCGTTKQAQIKAIPAKKLAALKNPNLGAILVSWCSSRRLMAASTLR